MKTREGHTVMIMSRGGGTTEVEGVEEGMRRRRGTSVEDVTIQGALTQYDEVKWMPYKEGERGCQYTFKKGVENGW